MAPNLPDVAIFGMRTILAGILLLALTAPSWAATVQGTASVVDGDTLVVQGKRIRLHGIDAPEATQTCQRSSGKKWPCGKGAADALTDFISRRLVICEGQDRDVYGRLIAVCSVWLVTEGLAVALPAASRLIAQEDQVGGADGLFRRYGQMR